MTTHTLYIGDALDVLRTLPDESVHCCVTSPPYWGQRDYGVTGQMGLEPSPDEYVAALVEVFREVRRILRRDGTLWVNIGDGYAYDDKWGGRTGGKHVASLHGSGPRQRKVVTGLKPGDLIMLPAMLAMALRADGWWLRSRIIWHKPNTIPESVDSRPTSSHEFLFLLTRSGDPTYWTHRDGNGSRTPPAPDYRWIDRARGNSETAEEPESWREERMADGRKRWRRINLWRGRDYFYDATAIREPAAATSEHDATGQGYIAPGQSPQGGNRVKVPAGWDTDEGAHGSIHRTGRSDKQRGHSRRHVGFNERWDGMTHAEQAQFGRNKRDVWVIAPEPFPGPHFATFPQKLVEPCVLAGCAEHVCPVCGAPWTRAIRTERVGPTWNQRGGKQRAAEEIGHNPQTGRERYQERYETLTVTEGFRPTCDCPGNDGQSGGVVLDPFGGAGTTTLVAKRLGRSSIYIDLSPDYARIAERRCFGQREIQEDYTYEVIDVRAREQAQP